METNQFQKFVNSFSVKMIVVSVLALMLLIPSFWIQDIVKERMKLKEHTEMELSEQWGKKQVVSGLVLNVPYTYLEAKPNDEGNAEHRAIAHFLPEELNVDALLTPEIRYRGIYKIPVYEGKVNVKGFFLQPDFQKLDATPKEVLWEEAYFTMGISDLRGIKDSVRIRINNQNATIEPGVADNDLYTKGITIKTGTVKDTDKIPFELEFTVNGSASFHVEPLGKKSEITIHSTWSNPSFSGAFLPSDRNIGKDGFEARWIVTHLNRNFPQQWMGKKFNTKDSGFGVDLFMPVDHYQKSMRSAKYAILFIALNFIVFLFIEISNKKRTHPFQYSLVAFALLLFYTLLVSIGEHIGFNGAFALSAVAITGLISWYSYSIIEKLKPALLITVLQAGLYMFLFTILQLQDYALLTGSIGLFVILALIMYGSRRIKWYNDISE
jgi:inner membrane protein